MVILGRDDCGRVPGMPCYAPVLGGPARPRCALAARDREPLPAARLISARQGVVQLADLVLRLRHRQAINRHDPVGSTGEEGQPGWDDAGQRRLGQKRLSLNRAIVLRNSACGCGTPLELTPVPYRLTPLPAPAVP